jgi:hypothetical protein
MNYEPFGLDCKYKYLNVNMQSNWRRYIDINYPYDKNCPYCSTIAQYEAVKLCFSKNPNSRQQLLKYVYSCSKDIRNFVLKKNIEFDEKQFNKYRDIIMEYLIEYRLKHDQQFKHILTQLKYSNILLYYDYRIKNVKKYDDEYETYWGAKKNRNKLQGRNKLGEIYNNVLKHQQQDQQQNQQQDQSQQITKDICILDYKIGEPISIAEGRENFINKTIDISRIHHTQKNTFNGTTINDLLQGQVDLKDCVQLKEDGYILHRDTFEYFLEQYRTEWRGKENVGFSTKLLIGDENESGCIYGNLVLYNYVSYQPQKPGILDIKKIKNTYQVKFKPSDKSAPKYYFQINYLSKNNKPFIFMATYQPVRFYLPINKIGKNLLILFIESFKKGNLFGFDNNNYVNFGRTHLKTSLSGTHSYPDEHYDGRVAGELSTRGITRYTASFNANQGKWSTNDPYPDETNFLLKWNI